MNRQTVVSAPITWLFLVLGSLACCGVAHAVMIVEASVTPGAGFYHYDFTITNTGPDDVVLVTLIDAPLGDPLIDPSLTVPAGFLGSYDPGLGFVDFLENFDWFAAGTISGPFIFDSLVGPDANSFSRFEALTSVGGLLTGCIAINGRCLEPEPVPEPQTWALLVLGLGCMSLSLGRSARMRR